jgi:hypothetical protein
LRGDVDFDEDEHPRDEKGQFAEKPEPLTVYTSTSGGQVKQAIGARPGTQNRQVKGQWVETDELGLAKKAADAGHKVEFLKETKKNQGVSNPDILLDGEKGEIKHVFTQSKNAIHRAMKRARAQGVTKVLIDTENSGFGLDEVESFVRRELGKHIKSALVWHGGKLHEIKK